MAPPEAISFCTNRHLCADVILLQIEVNENVVKAMWVFIWRLCTILVTSFIIRPSSSDVLVNQTGPRGIFARAYNNPYHPEDDGIIENISDIDGDNLKFGSQRDGDLTEAEKVKVVQTKKQKINGRYYDVPKNASEFVYD